MALVDYFLKLDGIEGESQDSKHKGEIDIQSFSFGASQSGTFASGGGGGAGKVAFQDIHFTHKVDKSSPKLMLACANGQHIKSGIVTCRKAGTGQQEYLKLTISDVLVSSTQVGGSSAGDLLPTDQFSLNFAKIEFSYQMQKADGSLDSPIIAGWDLKANKKV
jgi:type VI secretion system secreted protein Hcp